MRTENATPNDSSSQNIAEERRRVDKLVDDAGPCLCHYCGHDWYQLSNEETSVFGLQPDDMPRLVAVYALYASTIGMMCDAGIPDESIERIKADLPWLLFRQPSSGEFQRFAELFDASPDKAHAFFTKHEFWLRRVGVSVYPDA